MIEIPAGVGLTASDVYTASDSVAVSELESEPMATRLSAVLALLGKVSSLFNGREVKLTSLARSPERNASIPGASLYSHHVTGYAADFYIPGLRHEDVFVALRSLHPHLRFDELGLYDGHIHISADPRARGKVFDRRSEPEGAAENRRGAALVLVVVVLALFAVLVLNLRG